MSDNQSPGEIVVGVDGSEPSLDALRWAAHQAALTGVPLRVVMAWQLPVTYGYPVPYPDDFDPEADTERALAEAVTTALGANPVIEVHSEVVQGPPAPALLAASKGAGLLVVGSRGHGAFSGMLLGSVSEHCAHHAGCPVVIIRHRD